MVTDRSEIEKIIKAELGNIIDKNPGDIDLSQTGTMLDVDEFDIQETMIAVDRVFGITLPDYTQYNPDKPLSNWSEWLCRHLVTQEQSV